MGGAWYWLVWIFLSGVAIGALVCIALWLAGSERLKRVLALADLMEGIARSEQDRQDGSDEGGAPCGPR